MQNKVDLHIHTTCSDGTKTPNEVLKEAEEQGLERISITDHESVGAYDNLNWKLFSGIIIPGIELKTYCRRREIELLGYGISIEKMKRELPKLYKSKEEINEDYLKAIVERLISLGIKLPENVRKEYTDKTLQPAKYITKVIVSNQETMKENMKKMYDDNITHDRTESLYRGWLSNPKSNFYVKFQGYPDDKETIRLIKECGGEVFIPHIFQYQEMSQEILEELLSNKEISGIECYYPTFTQKQTQGLLALCSKKGLFVSGGSDYHGANKKNELGTGLNHNLFIPEEKVKVWTNMLVKRLNRTCERTEENRVEEAEK